MDDKLKPLRDYLKRAEEIKNEKIAAAAEYFRILNSGLRKSHYCEDQSRTPLAATS